MCIHHDLCSTHLYIFALLIFVLNAFSLASCQYLIYPSVHSSIHPSEHALSPCCLPGTGATRKRDMAKTLGQTLSFLVLLRRWNTNHVLASCDILSVRAEVLLRAIHHPYPISLSSSLYLETCNTSGVSVEHDG